METEQNLDLRDHNEAKGSLLCIFLQILLSDLLILRMCFMLLCLNDFKFVCSETYEFESIVAPRACFPCRMCK